LIATLTYSFARITAALKMKVEDLRPRGAGWTVRLHEKGGKQHAMPCHHALAEASPESANATAVSSGIDRSPDETLPPRQLARGTRRSLDIY
jgi:hypothetical protein